MNINTETEIEVDLNTESDQAMRAAHSCNSWLEVIVRVTRVFLLSKSYCKSKVIQELYLKALFICNLIDIMSTPYLSVG